MWAVNADEFHDGRIYRIDPESNQITLVKKLSFPAGGMTAAFGSIWVSDYFGNAVWRLSTTGAILARVPTGLQPQAVHAAFGSMWSSDHHGASLTRINPATNTVLDTLPAGAPDTFRDGPQDFTSDGTRLYVGDSNLQSLQSVNPATDAVTTPASIPDAFCGPMAAIAGYVWSADACTGTTYQLRTDGSVQQVIKSDGFPASLTTMAGKVWIGDDRTTGAVLVERDPQTGAVVGKVRVGGDASSLTPGFGDLWLFDANSNVIRRVRV
jgi:streptogramin lyase